MERKALIQVDLDRTYPINAIFILAIKKKDQVQTQELIKYGRDSEWIAKFDSYLLFGFFILKYFKSHQKNHYITFIC